MIRILHTADWHIGDFTGPTKDGRNLRALDTERCIEALIEKAREIHPNITMISGDIFDRTGIGDARSLREVGEAISAIEELAHASDYVIVLRGTPNHDGFEQFERLKQYFAAMPSVKIVTEPSVVGCLGIDVACIPGFDKGIFRAHGEALSKEEENVALTQELSNICMGLKAQCDAGRRTALMAHYTVPGCNPESSQSMFLQKFEPVIPAEALQSAHYDLVVLGHIHRPQQLNNLESPCFYSGAVNALNFNDEGQKRGFYIHELSLESGEVQSQFVETPYRQFITYRFTDEDISDINRGYLDEVAERFWRTDGSAKDKIVRILYTCSAENNKALNKAELSKALLADGAFYVWEINPEKDLALANREIMNTETDPEKNLRRYLDEKGFEEELIQRRILKAREIIAKATAENRTSLMTGAFVPVSIEVENYRNYVQEAFDFSDISFCTINGQNGAGKSSLFMDAILDCLYEEPREGKGNKNGVPWVRKADGVKKGSISFTFRIGEKTFRVIRTRDNNKSARITLNISEYLDGEWVNRSAERAIDTQKIIEQILGMDSETFKSCALIMQDQYGLFLQANKDVRMDILGKLLGMDIYAEMKMLASEKARLFGGKKAKAHEAIALRLVSIDSFGDPESELKESEEKMKQKKEQMEDLQERRQYVSESIRMMEEAQNREAAFAQEAGKLGSEIEALTARIRSSEETEAECLSQLSGKDLIIEKADEYRTAKAAAEETQEEAALYRSKKTESEKLRLDADMLQSKLTDAKASVDTDRITLESYKFLGADDEEIFLKEQEYLQTKAAHEQESRKEQEYGKAFSLYTSKVSEIESVKRLFEEKYRALDIRRENLQKKVDLLHTSGCVDIENANCEFLKDAKTAKAELEGMYCDCVALNEDRDNQLSALEQEKQELLKKAEACGYSAERMTALITKLAELQKYESLAAQARDRKQKIAVIEAAMEPKQSNILDLEKRLSTAISEADRAVSDAENLKESYHRHMEAKLKMTELEEWIRKESDLPVVEERYSHVKERLAADREALETARIALEAKTAAIDKERENYAKLPSAKALRMELDQSISFYEKDVAEIQKSIGAAQQKISEMAEYQEQISELKEELLGYSEEAADYDCLKVAFSNAGIPHQIVMSVLPKLSDTANSILGQMTGGKMGVSFLTEKVNTSGKEKEVLEVVIEEYGKHAMPYLSKSGGEKVKSSLSVVLALAELKTTAAGIQLGMLFIDEPPFLDDEGVQAYCDALETIQHRYPDIKIMAITHDIAMKARFPQGVTIVKDDDGSHVNWD